MPEIVVIAHDIRSCHNVGSLLRTADGFGVSKVYLTGYTPYPAVPNDSRLPHITRRLTQQIHKTALGAEQNTHLWQHHENVQTLLSQLKKSGHEIVGLEQSATAIALPSYTPSSKIAIILGREVEGLDVELQAACDTIVEIPMQGSKESFNVTEAATAALYHCRFSSF